MGNCFVECTTWRIIAIVSKLNRMSQKKILLIEDDPMLREALVEQFVDEGYSVHGSNGAEDAYKYLKIEHPDVIITDLVMQNIGGLEIVETVKGNPELAHIPVLVLSNSGTERDKVRAKELGVLDFIVKSDTPLSKLVTHIEKILEEAGW